MRLYLVRHGKATSDAEDPRRPLSESGRKKVGKVARQLARADVRPGEIRHSGKLRAQETAEILAEHLQPASGLQIQSGLSPDDDPASAAELAATAETDTMLVGHLPHLGRLASLLLCGNGDKDLILFKTATIVCLERGSSGDPWLLRWILSPEVAGD